MAIIRKHQRDTYTVIDNGAIRDDTLSWRATGLLAYLLSLPEGWKIRTNDLVNRKTDGRTAVLSTMTELETAGYLRRTKVRDTRGHLRTYIDISESPEMMLAMADQPTLDAPTSAEPNVGQRPHKKEPEELPTEGSPTDLVADVPRETSRPANPTWDALEDVFGYRADGAEAGLWGQIINKANQEPDPATEVRIRASRLVAQWGPGRLTPGSLKKWWDRFGSPLGAASEEDAERIREKMTRAARQAEALAMDAELAIPRLPAPDDPSHLADRATIIEANELVEEVDA